MIDIIQQHNIPSTTSQTCRHTHIHLLNDLRTQLHLIWKWFNEAPIFLGWCHSFTMLLLIVSFLCTNVRWHLCAAVALIHIIWEEIGWLCSIAIHGIYWWVHNWNIIGALGYSIRKMSLTTYSHLKRKLKRIAILNS